MTAPVPVPILVWFDEDCGVCSASVRFLQAHADPSVRFLPSHGLTDPGLRARADLAVVVVGPRGVEEGAAAVATVLERCGPTGRIASIGLGLPGIAWVAERVYRWVARNRGAISRRLGLAAGCDLS